MYILKSETTFDSSHFLSGYDGKCSNLHGHTWRILAEIYSEKLVSYGQCRGMVVDFGDLKRELKELAEQFDHTLIYEKNTLKPETVSALKSENFKNLLYTRFLIYNEDEITIIIDNKIIINKTVFLYNIFNGVKSLLS